MKIKQTIAELGRTHFKTLIGIGLGLSGGYAYWYFIGCVSGTCPITSNPVISTLYGGMMGGLLLNSFQTKEKELKNDER